MINASTVFVGAVTFLGCWFACVFSAIRASKPSGREVLIGRTWALSILACWVVDLAITAEMWCHELGTVVGLAAWGFVSLGK